MKSRAGYEYLLTYKITVPIYDLTVEFCRCYIKFNSRTYDQMVQAARSGMQNLSEGSKQQGMKGYIKLCGVSRGSLEELLKDYLAYARQNRLTVWPREKCIREIREIGEIWEIIRKNPSLPNHPNFPSLPKFPNYPNPLEISVNLMVTIINQANYLIDKLIISLKEKHMREGGLTEELYRRRIAFRRRRQ